MSCFYTKIWCLEKDWNVFIFQVDFGNFGKCSRKKNEKFYNYFIRKTL